MFSAHDIADIRRCLERGDSPEQIAKSLGLSRSTFMLRLTNSGYRVRIRRDLKPIRTVQPVRSNATIAIHATA